MRVERVSTGTYQVTLPQPDGRLVVAIADAMGMFDHPRERVRKRRKARAFRLWNRVRKRRLGAHDWAGQRQGDGSGGKSDKETR
jgi:hypothetical protein